MEGFKYLPSAAKLAKIDVVVVPINKIQCYLEMPHFYVSIFKNLKFV